MFALVATSMAGQTKKEKRGLLLGDASFNGIHGGFAHGYAGHGYAAAAAPLTSYAAPALASYAAPAFAAPACKFSEEKLF